MGLLPDYTSLSNNTVSDVSQINTPFSALYSLLGSTSNAPTFSDANVATAAAIAPAKISGTAATLSASNVFTGTNTFMLGASALSTGGLIKIDTTTNSSSGAADLTSYTLTAATLSTGRGLRITAWGTKASSTNAASVQMQFGGNVLITKMLPATAVGTTVWKIVALVFQTGGSTQTFLAEAFHNMGTSGAGTVSGTDGALVASRHAASTIAVNEANAIIIKCNASVATTTEVSQLGLLVEGI